MSKTAFIDHVRIQGFRSLADVELSEIPKATVLIGANGSGKSNFIRFFEMLSWMLGSRRLAEFVEKHGGADDQLFGGNKRTPRIEAEVTLAYGSGAVTTISLYFHMRIPTASSSAKSVSDSTAILIRRKRRGNIWKVGIKKPRLSWPRSPANLMMSTPPQPG